MSCVDDANQFVGNVALFTGAETANWTQQQFIDAANFCKKHAITCMIVKVAEVTSSAGDIWYNGIPGVQSIAQAIESVGVKFLPYQFMWGNKYNELSTEISVAESLLNAFSCLALDVEGSSWSGTIAGQWGTQVNDALVSNTGKLFMILPANPIDAGQQPAFQAMSPSVNVWIPMAYDTSLAGDWVSQITQINSQACIFPALDMSSEFGENSPSTIAGSFRLDNVPAMAIWEYGYATQNTSLLDSVIQSFTNSQQQGGNMSLILNSKGMVLDIQQSYQLENGESQDLCGPWSVSSLMYAGVPNKGPAGTAEQIDTWADNEANKYMPNGQVNWPGTSIQQMYQFLTDAQDPTSKQRNLHWWDLGTVDVAHITAAVKAGYPVLITANEQNIIEKTSGQRAYPWNLNTNHILPIVGIDKDGDFICADELNNNFQGYWPPVYLASRLQPSWATIVQVVGPDPANPWLKSIPSDDPTTWQQGFNAQNFSQSQPPVSPPQPPPQGTNYFEQEATDCWNSFFQNTLKETPPPTGTGIYNSWFNAWKSSHKQYGPPTTFEYTSVDDAGHKIIVQEFHHARCEWNTSGQANWYSLSGNA